MSSSNSSYRAQENYSQIPNEYDSGERDAQFFLYTRPLDGSVLQDAEHIQLHHWALIAVFEDESFRTMEAGDVNGELWPTYLKEVPKEDTSSENQGKYWKLIELVTSPKILHKATKENSLNGTEYSVNSNNCQNWVKKCAEKISSELVSALRNYRACGEVNIVSKAAMCSWASSRSLSRSSSRSCNVRNSLLSSCNFRSSRS